MGSIPRSGGFDDDVLYEHQFLEKWKQLAAKIGDSEIYVRYRFAGGLLVAKGFQLVAHERTIGVHLQRESPSGEANAALQLSLPEEETAQYRWYEDERGGMYLSVAFPHCDRHPLEDIQIAHLEVATTSELLDREANSPLVQ